MDLGRVLQGWWHCANHAQQVETLPIELLDIRRESLDVSPSAITLRRGPGQGAGRVANQQSRSTVSTHDPAIKRWSEIGVTACGDSGDMSHGPGARKALARLAVSGGLPPGLEPLD